MNKFIVKPNKTLEEINNERRKKEDWNKAMELAVDHFKNFAREQEEWERIKRDLARQEEHKSILPSLLGFVILFLSLIMPWTYVVYFVIANYI